MEQYFFLNGGPGLSTGPERLWMDAPREMHLYDQPRFLVDVPFAFRHLKDAAAAAFHKQARHGPIVLVASSFAVHLALDLIVRCPADIARLVLISPTLAPRDAYLALAEQVSEVLQDCELAEKARAVQACPADSDAFWAMIGILLTQPDLLDQYWGQGALQRRDELKRMLGDANIFDFATFYAVLNDFLFGDYPRSEIMLSTALNNFTKPVTVAIGRDDILWPHSAASNWMPSCPPQTRILSFPAGHFLHLEVPVRDWLY